MKLENKQMHCRFSPRRMCNPCGYTMKISFRYHRILIYDVKRTTKIDGKGPFNIICTVFRFQSHAQTDLTSTL